MKFGELVFFEFKLRPKSFHIALQISLPASFFFGLLFNSLQCLLFLQTQLCLDLTEFVSQDLDLPILGILSILQLCQLQTAQTELPNNNILYLDLEHTAITIIMIHW